MNSTALKTDHYEYTMLDAALAEGKAETPCVFEVFARSLPEGRRYGVVGGTGRILDAIDQFLFTDEVLQHLQDEGIVSDEALQYLDDLTGFGGNVMGYREGDLYFPYSPILTVQAPFGQAVLLETLILSILNADSAIGGAASRMVQAAEGRKLLEGGGRRTNEEAAVAAARMAYICGFDATSNLEAGKRYGVPTGGTTAHAFTLLHETEQEAFAAQVARFGANTTFLVDTYDIPTGINHAVSACQAIGEFPAAVRIDSGDLVEWSFHARNTLDLLKAYKTRITVSGDLDEYAIQKIRETNAPIDTFLVGTKLVTGSGDPTCGMVYKLVAVGDGPDGSLRAVEKRSKNKGNPGGRKLAWRMLDEQGFAYSERINPRGFDDQMPTDSPDARALQIPLVVNGERVHTPTLLDLRDHHRRALEELRPIHLDLSAGHPALNK